MKSSTSPEYDAFTSLVDRVLAVPHSEIQKRVEAHRKEAAKNPHRRGPKPKRKRRVSRVATAHI
jgi:hypothetical protein